MRSIEWSLTAGIYVSRLPIPNCLVTSKPLICSICAYSSATVFDSGSPRSRRSAYSGHPKGGLRPGIGAAAAAEENRRHDGNEQLCGPAHSSTVAGHPPTCPPLPSGRFRWLTRWPDRSGTLTRLRQKRWQMFDNRLRVLAGQQLAREHVRSDDHEHDGVGALLRLLLTNLRVLCTHYPGEQTGAGGAETPHKACPSSGSVRIWPSNAELPL